QRITSGMCSLNSTEGLEKNSASTPLKTASLLSAHDFCLFLHLLFEPALYKATYSLLLDWCHANLFRNLFSFFKRPTSEHRFVPLRFSAKVH
ncbi:MAG: hypothetical protein IJ057_03340, partial [Bacteroidales bacterium]|nr:hypothetical protein [Bacteroidales bacterium]